MSARRVTVVDYDVGNLLSVRRAFEHVGAEVEITSDHAAIAGADRLVLPGVGAFGDCIAALDRRELVELVHGFIGTGRPFLGICVGMQLLFDESEEFGRHAGLGHLAGSVRPIPATGADGTPHKIPHIGWTPLALPEGKGQAAWDGTILAGVAPGQAVYFVHSFTAAPSRPADRLADASYNGRLVSAAVHRDNVAATQFHPEKSGPVGLRIVENFVGL